MFNAFVFTILAVSSTALEIGMMYEGWHAPAFWGRNFETNLTVEDVIRSNGALTLSNMSAGFNESRRMGFWFHKQPKDGFYCIYRKRGTENVSSCGLPDCPNIEKTAERHARHLDDAGVSFIVMDSTNIQNTGPSADALQLRPWQVLAEEWLSLNARGIKTPKMAVWQNLQDPQGDLYREYLDNEYSDSKFENLIFKDQRTGKKVFFATADPDSRHLDALLREVYVLYADYVLKNPFYEDDMPIQVEKFDERVQKLAADYNSKR